MKMPIVRFNIYLLLLTLCFLGCKTPEEKKKSKEASTLRLYLEVRQSGSDQRSGVPIFRQHPVYVSVEREPFLTEADLDSASVIDMPGGFAIRAQFNGHATLLLENVTVGHKGQRIAIQSSFGESRWLAAPMISRRIPNGELVFTPDATREESDRIVRGLTNVIAKIKKKENSFF